MGKAFPEFIDAANRLDRTWNAMCHRPFSNKTEAPQFKIIPVMAIIEKIYFVCAIFRYATIALKYKGFIHHRYGAAHNFLAGVKFCKYQYSIFSRILCLPSPFVSFMIFVLREREEVVQVFVSGLDVLIRYVNIKQETLKVVSLHVRVRIALP